MYVLHAILLSKQTIRDNQIRVVLFTREFWKITAWAKKAYVSSDIWVIVEALIERKKQENIIHKLHPLSIPKNDGWDYRATIEFLTLFHLIKEILPEWLEQKSIFEDTAEVLQHLSNIQMNWWMNNKTLVQLFILMKARLMKKQWFLKQELFSWSPTLPAIYQRLDIASMKSMISSKYIQDSCLCTIENAVHEWIHSIKNRI